MEREHLQNLRLLSKEYPSQEAVVSAIVGLNAQLHLPKATEHFVSDIHGEYESFQRVLNHASGSIKRRIDELFGEQLTEKEKRALGTLIYYPEIKLPLILQGVDDRDQWYRETIVRLIEVCRSLSSKYLRSRVKELFSGGFATIIEELLFEQENHENKFAYYRAIIDTIIATQSPEALMASLAKLIQHLAIAHLHVVGDIYDRGPGAYLIMDALMKYHSVDIQWGNHDVLWMGAAAGSEACIANVIRICLRYGHLETLENAYGISLMPLVSLAIETYADDPCTCFQPQSGHELEEAESELKLHKAISIIQFKLEAQITARRPKFQMAENLLIDKISAREGTVRVGDAVHPLLDTHFPTLNPAKPFALTERERSVVNKLKHSFLGSEKLQQHTRFLYARGGIYLAYNGNLLYHGCIPMNDDGSFKTVEVNGKLLAGRALLEEFERLARNGYFADQDDPQKQAGLDTLWYLWCGPDSPLFGKDKMATFERYFIADKSTHRETRSPYYTHRASHSVACAILQEFGLDPDRGHVINGHVPVRVKQGENSVKGEGKLIVIDGGFSKAYHSRTGIAGYTLVFNSYGLLLATHHEVESAYRALREDMDIACTTRVLERNDVRIRMKDTDLGRESQQRIDDLKSLLTAYRTGLVQEGLTVPPFRSA